MIENVYQTLHSQNDSRIFTVKGKKFTLSKAIVNHLKSYNTNSAFRTSEAYDRIFINTLLVLFIIVHTLKNYETEPSAMQLIKGSLEINSQSNSLKCIFLTKNTFTELYELRVRSDEAYLQKLKGYVNDKCKQLAEKY